MTPEKQRIAIAEACGLDVIHDPAGPKDRPEAWKTGYFTPTAAKQRRLRWPSSAVVKVIPDYPNDLNAMHEAEKMLTDDQFERYVVELGRVFYPKGRGPWKWSECPAVVVRATAAQRAEAFLRTLGKWEDDK